MWCLTLFDRTNIKDQLQDQFDTTGQIQGSKE